MTWEALNDIHALLLHAGVSSWPTEMITRSQNALVALRTAVAGARESGRLVIYRAVNVSQLRQVKWDNIGRCWSYDEASAIAYFGMHRVHGRIEPMRLRLRANASLTDIDWDATVHLNITNTREREVRLKPGTVVQIDGGVYFAANLRRWVPLQIKRSFRAHVHEYDSCDSWTPLPPRRKR